MICNVVLTRLFPTLTLLALLQKQLSHVAQCHEDSVHESCRVGRLARDLRGDVEPEVCVLGNHVGHAVALVGHGTETAAGTGLRMGWKLKGKI